MTGPDHLTTRSGRRQQGSLAITHVGVLLVMAVMAAIVTVEVAGLLRQVRVAQAAADGAALAAVTATQPGATASPRSAARRVAEAHETGLESCTCRGGEVTVTVGAPVASRLVELLGLTTVRASATATLVPDREPVPGAEPLSGSLVGHGGSTRGRPAGT